MFDNPPNGPDRKKLKKHYKIILDTHDDLGDVLDEGLSYHYTLDTLKHLSQHQLDQIDFEVFVFMNEIKHCFDEFLFSKTKCLSECNSCFKIEIIQNLIKLVDFVSTIDESLNYINNDDLIKILDNPLHNKNIKKIDDDIKSTKEWEDLCGEEYCLEYERMVAFINDNQDRMDNILENRSKLKKKQNKNIKKRSKIDKRNTDEHIDRDSLLLYFAFRDIHHGMDIIKPNDTSQTLSYKQLFKEIRDGIAHSNYALCDKGIYINNPASDSHGKDFECTIKWDSLEKISDILKKYKNKDYHYVIKDIDNLKFPDGIEEILKNIHLERMDNNGDAKECLLMSENMKNMMRDFFKNHSLNKDNLEFVINILTGNSKSTFHNRMRDIFSCLDLYSTTFETLENNIKNKKSNDANINSVLHAEYIPNYILLLFIYKYYIKNIQSSPRRTPNNQISTEEHRRNAFAHGNFAILPGVEYILLWDPPQDKISRTWEEKIDLKSLYNECKSNLERDHSKPLEIHSLPKFKNFRKFKDFRKA